MATRDSGAAQDARPSSPGRQSLLLLARPGDEAAAAYCRDHLDAVAAPAPIVVLAEEAAARCPPARRVDHVGVGRPTGAGVGTGDATADAPAASPAPTPTLVAGTDLGALGRAVDGHVEAGAAAGRQPVVCVDSLGGLVEGASIRAAYRLLFVLRRRVGNAGGGVHLHADPGVFEEEILRTVTALFDRVVAFRPGGAPR